MMPDMLRAAMFEYSSERAADFATLARDECEKEPFMSRCYKLPIRPTWCINPLKQ
jgi:hypothetical protein